MSQYARDLVNDDPRGTPSPACDVQPRKPGRPRDPQVDEAIMKATLDLLCEQGFGGMTVDDVAARAGVGKATIYRRWATREHLVLDAARQVMEDAEVPDTGSLRDDLISRYQHFRTKSPNRSEQLMGQVLVEATVNPELKHLMQEFIAERRRGLRVIIDRAVARGELTDSIDVDLLMDVIAGTLLHRALFTDAKVTEATVARIVDVAVAGVTG